MFSVTLIGPDGAGKTTITRRLETSGLLPFRYLYMGVNLAASNAALPTSRLVHLLKRRRRRAGPAGPRPAGSNEGRRRGRSGLRAAARLASRLAEEWYRQLVSWWYQLRGFVVLYDRHFVFDFAPEIAGGGGVEQRLHRWFLALYPQPDLVIFLDAPGEVLFARKGESTAAELERRRQAFLRQGERVPNFVAVDATRPLDEVYAEVAALIVGAVADRRRRPAAQPVRADSGL
jgi:thymidylate kinase